MLGYHCHSSLSSALTKQKTETRLFSQEVLEVVTAGLSALNMNHYRRRSMSDTNLTRCKFTPDARVDASCRDIAVLLCFSNMPLAKMQPVLGGIGLHTIVHCNTTKGHEQQQAIDRGAHMVQPNVPIDLGAR